MSIYNQDLMLINRGALAEQFVGQELIAHAPNYLPRELYYWTREKTGATAEVDYVINIDNLIVPIEVKAGKTGRLKAMQYFLENKESASSIGIRISAHTLSFEKNILSVPLYMISELSRLWQAVL